MPKVSSKKKKMIIIGIILILAGCSSSVIDDDTESPTEVRLEKDSEVVDYNTEENSVYEETVLKYEIVDDSGATYSLQSLPAYSGVAYIELNNNVPEFSDNDKTITKPFEFYSDLDNLGRCGQAYANICEEIEPTEERGSIGAIKPSGWHTVKYNELIEGNYLYNRCHLIGYQLAGENANEKNLITGTRYLNMVGMLEFENRVDDYVDSTGNHVLYRVTPIFEGDNLVASGVQMEGWSVEDSGEGVCFNVYCYNVQPGITIDYATGDSWISTGTENVGVNSQDEVFMVGEDANQDEIYDFVINTNTKKFHISTCSSIKDMAEHNKKLYSGTVQEVIDEGYQPCHRCLSQYK